MGDDCLTVKRAWAVFDQWLLDPRIELRREPPEIDEWFRRATTPFSYRSAPKAVGDCYLLALSRSLNATLVTLDSGVADLTGRAKQPVTLLR